jgi:heterodisulfide reductase subunit A-like polyferredoxin
MHYQAMYLRSLLLLAGFCAACRHAAAQQAPEAATAAASTSSMNSSSIQPQVLIIGAGMAGVAAARELTDNGISVLLLEARNRPGGWHCTTAVCLRIIHEVSITLY